MESVKTVPGGAPWEAGACAFLLSERDFPCSAGVERDVGAGFAHKGSQGGRNDTIANHARVMA